MRLEVPLVRQKPDSPDCGLAMVSMLLRYYGIPQSIDDIRPNIDAYNTGTYIGQLGTYLLCHGLDVEIISQATDLFTLHDRKLSAEKLEQKLQRLYQMNDHERNDLQYTREHREAADSYARSYAYHLDFVRMGGRLTIDIPTKEHVCEWIAKGNPLGANVTTRFLWKKDAISPNGHYTVITGVTEDKVFVNDPSSHKRSGGRQVYGLDEYIYATHAHAGTLLRVRPK